MASKTRRLAVVAAARDCGRHLPAALSNIAALASCYDDARFVFAVSDSIDDTEIRLARWLAGTRKGSVLQLGALEPTLPMRTMRIAAARNACLDELRRCGERFDHLLVVDLDDVLGTPVPREAFRRAAGWLDQSDERVAVTANSAPRYYDIWALRHERWCPYDVWQPIWNRPQTRSFEMALFREVLCRQIALPAHLPPLPVQSSFGGLALYKAGPALAGRYRGIDEAGLPVCEHVPFNRTLTDGGRRMFIFPSLLVQAGADHLYDPAQFAQRWRLILRGRRLIDRWLPPWRRYVVPAAWKRTIRSL